MITTTTTQRAAGSRRAAGRHRGAHRGLPRRRLTIGDVTGWQRCLSVAWTILAIAGTAVGTCAVVLVAATRLSPLGQFTAFGHPVLVAASDSMSPVIRTGDLIVDDPVAPAAASRLRIGQVISFRAAPGSSVIITRRIAGVARSRGAVRYYTKDDANPAVDLAARPAADVVGVYSYAIRDGGSALTALHRPLVLGLLIGSPLLWLLAGPLLQLAPRRR